MSKKPVGSNEHFTTCLLLFVSRFRAPLQYERIVVHAIRTPHVVATYRTSFPSDILLHFWENLDEEIEKQRLEQESLREKEKRMLLSDLHTGTNNNIST